MSLFRIYVAVSDVLSIDGRFLALLPPGYNRGHERWAESSIPRP
jgi:hypothetical protein